MAEETNNPEVQGSPQEPSTNLLTAGIVSEFGLKPEELTGEQKTETEVQGEAPAEGTEQPAEGTQQPPKPAEGQTQQVEDWFDIQKINERFGTEFQTEDEIKEKIGSLSEAQEYLSKKDYFATLEEEYGKIVEAANPITLFGSKEAYEDTMMRLALGKDNLAAVVDDVLGGDVKAMDDLHAIYLATINKSPEVLKYASADEIKKSILEDAGVDVSDPDFNLASYKDSFKANTKGLIRLVNAGSQAKKEFNDLVAQAKQGIPEIKDFKTELENKTQQRKQSEADRTAKVQKLTDEWGGKVKDITGRITKLEFKEKGADGKEVVDFTFDIPKEFVDKVKPYLVEYAVKAGFEVSQENADKLESELVSFFKEEYSDEIRKAYANDKLSKFKEEMDARVNNPRPVNTTEAPAGHAQSEIDAINENFRKIHGLG